MNPMFAQQNMFNPYMNPNNFQHPMMAMGNQMPVPQNKAAMKTISDLQQTVAM
jgi:hypothetical protein